MNSYITGELIKKLREKKNLTQLDLANILSISEKTISKWETGKGLPDISLLEPLSKALNVSIVDLFNGNNVENTNIHGNMFNYKFYVCPICNNIISSIGECNVTCHGINLEILKEKNSNIIQYEKIEDELFVNIPHEMSKEKYISFIAGVSNNQVQIVKMYPEQGASCRLKISGLRYIYFYDNKEGLYKQLINIKNKKSSI